MSTSAINSSSSGVNSTANDARTILGNNFDSFLKLLTTQLQNQDPLSPMETHEFTNQLVMFAEAEQAIATNSKLDSLITIGQNSEASQALSYHGKQVRVKGNELSFLGDPVDFQYTMPDEVASAEMSVRDLEGRVVFTRELSSAQSQEGDHNLSWDGRNDFGYVLSNGLYTVSVSAQDSEGNPLTVSNFTTTASVRGVEYEDGKTWLDVGYYKVTLDNVESITSPAFDINDQARAMSFVGSHVHITGSTSPIKNGALSLTYNTYGTQNFQQALQDETLKKVELRFYDTGNNLVKTVDVANLLDAAKLVGGEKRIDMKLNDISDGDYQVKMNVEFSGVDEGGNPTGGSKFADIPLGYSGKVRRVVFQNGEVRFEINDVLYDPNDIGSVVSQDVTIYKL